MARVRRSGVPAFTALFATALLIVCAAVIFIAGRVSLTLWILAIGSLLLTAVAALASRHEVHPEGDGEANRGEADSVEATADVQRTREG